MNLEGNPGEDLEGHPGGNLEEIFLDALASLAFKLSLSLQVSD